MSKPDARIWEGCIAHVRRHYPAISRQWFEQLEVEGLAGGVLTVEVVEPVRLRYLQKECAEVFNEAVQTVTNRLITVRFIGPDGNGAIADAPAVPAASSVADLSSRTNGHAESQTEPVVPIIRAGRLRAHPRHENGSAGEANRNAHAVDRHAGDASWGTMYEDMVINPDYTFENFVQGPNNRLAFAAAKAVADKPGDAYNPFFVHGGVGLGKTHLLQAICQKVMADAPDVRIYYVSCEGFASQLMEAVQAGEMSEFRHRFRDIDMLVVDDIHFLGGHEQTQEEFFHTFNSLHQARKQIVLSSDAPPSDIPDIEERLLSRFKSGLVAKIEKPCYETRVYILKTKARLRNIDIGEDVICFLANAIDSNIRELEGALTQVQGLAMATDRVIEVDLAREAIGEHRTATNARITIQDIISAVGRRFEVKQSDLLSKKKNKSIAGARQVAMYIARRHTGHSLQEIGGFFGGRDHTTVMHGINKIEAQRGSDDRLDRQISSVEDELLATHL